MHLSPDDLPPFRVRPIELANAQVRLEPLRPEHGPDLFAIGQDEATWRYMPRPAFTDNVDAARWVADRLNEVLAGTRVCYVIRRLADDTVAGFTCLYDFRRPERALEIGYTWLAPAACRSEVNTATKLLLLTHCFETLGCRRVQFKTDARNLTSQRAIERLGATKEGTLRRHMVVHGTYQRDTVFYSLLPEEWPEVKTRLTHRLTT
ncbi:GNAT family N-acetyltransferase [Actomonas aquatica]|uniref:GNAT family protein n=1 Tax=Actomonas aquatica TaxID=2866162 RepID=A0ABZ1C417_9BACT|nr:GNAT family protein [Opitutus sp. WL0086]WRQ86429.1 GNAT family protein [Opitutus sp. WL0086]